MSSQLVYSALENKGVGNYTVEILIGEDTTPAATVNFSIK